MRRKICEHCQYSRLNLYTDTVICKKHKGMIYWASVACADYKPLYEGVDYVKERSGGDD